MFCSQCGQELPDGSKFCKECGAPLNPSYEGVIQGQTVAAAGPGTFTSNNTGPDPSRLEIINQCVVGSMIAAGVMALLALVGRNGVFAIIDGGIGTAIYFLVYRKLESKEYETAKSALMGCAIACGIIGLLVVLAGDIGGIVGLGMAGALGYSFKQLE